jgi:hypothetical protein
LAAGREQGEATSPHYDLNAAPQWQARSLGLQRKELVAACPLMGVARFCPLEQMMHTVKLPRNRNTTTNANRILSIPGYSQIMRKKSHISKNSALELCFITS